MYSALIVAAGLGSRTELGYNKVFYEVHFKPIIQYSVERFLSDPEFSEIILVYAKDELDKMKLVVTDQRVTFVEGGRSRQESVYLGLQHVTNAVVFIHDGARPNLKQTDLDLLKSRVYEADALTLAVQVVDTVKRVQDGKIVGDVPRNECYFIQTPQVFVTDAIKTAHEALHSSKLTFSDDTSLYLAYHHGNVLIVEGSHDNIKVTTKFDLLKLEELL